MSSSNIECWYFSLRRRRGGKISTRLTPSVIHSLSKCRTSTSRLVVWVISTGNGDFREVIPCPPAVTRVKRLLPWVWDSRSP